VAVAVLVAGRESVENGDVVVVVRHLAVDALPQLA
jgi:hypothetical protein